MPTIPTRPTRRSIFSDIASAGAGLASGFKKEQQRLEQKQIEAAMREFDQSMKTQQLGIQQGQLDLARTAEENDQEYRAASIADMNIKNTLTQRDLSLREQNYKDEAEHRRLQRKFEYDKLNTDIMLERERMANAVKLKRLDVADQANRNIVGQLNTMRDNLRSEYTDFVRDNGDIAAYRYDKTNTLANLTNEVKKHAVLNADGSINLQESQKNRNFNTAYDRLQKVEEFKSLLQKKREVDDALQKAVFDGNDLAKQAGAPVSSAPSEKRWSNFSNEEKAASLDAIAMTIKNKAAIGEAVNYDKWLDLGVTEDELDMARQKAGLVAAQEMQQAPMQAPQIQAPMGEVAPDFQPPKAPSGGKKFQLGPTPGPVRPPSGPMPGSSAQQRAPILSGPLNQLAPTFQPSPFAFDTSRHRILRPSIGRRPF